MFFNRFIKIGLACVLLYVFSCATLVAADAGAVKIGIMNVQKVLVESAAGQKAKAKVEKNIR